MAQPRRTFESDPSIEVPPTMEELPYEDDEPMESDKHREQMSFLIDTLKLHFQDRPDVFVGGNMGVYYSTLQTVKNEFRAPDFFVALGVTRQRERLSWVIWEEEVAPSVVIELLSWKTEANDRGIKKSIYAKAMRVQDYYLFHPLDLDFEGYTLDAGQTEYRRMDPEADGGFPCRALGLRLVVVTCEYHGKTTEWLRFATTDGTLLPSGAEMAAAERAKADEERAKADAERAKADAERAKADAERAKAERLAAKLRAAGIDPGE